MDLYEVTFRWPWSEPSIVIATGSFDQWTSSIYLDKTESGFVGSAKIPWGEKIAFKFVVDGQWLTAPDQETESDASGNINNIFTAPLKPVSEPVNEVNVDRKAVGHDSALPAVIEDIADATPATAEPIPTADTYPPTLIIPMPVVPVNAPENTVPASSPGDTTSAVSTHIRLAPISQVADVPISNQTTAPTSEEPIVPAAQESVTPSTPAPKVDEVPASSIPMSTVEEPAVPVQVKEPSSATTESTDATSSIAKEVESALSTPATSAPSTPVKRSSKLFPSTESSPGGDSKYGTIGSRKKRTSIFGRIGSMFSPGKEKAKEKK